MLAEGLDVFRYTVPRALAGSALAATRIREATGCSVVAVQTGGGTEINPPADRVLPAGGELILVGTTDAERAFVRRFGS